LYIITSFFMKGTIHVYECNSAESKQGNTYYKVFGRMGGCVYSFISDINLKTGHNDVEVELSEYKGEIKLRIVA